MVEVRFYSETWFKVEYKTDLDKLAVDFKAWRIIKMDYDNVARSEVDEGHCLSGFIKWDGYCEFDYSDSCNDISMVKQFCLLMEEIYKYKEDHIK